MRAKNDIHTFIKSIVNVKLEICHLIINIQLTSKNPKRYGYQRKKKSNCDADINTDYNSSCEEINMFSYSSPKREEIHLPNNN